MTGGLAPFRPPGWQKIINAETETVIGSPRTARATTGWIRRTPKSAASY